MLDSRILEGIAASSPYSVMNLARILQRFWVLTAMWELLSGFITSPTRMSLGRYLKAQQWHIVAACY
jgi:hypothetical protein